MRWFKTFVILCALVILSGCAGVGIVATNDPLVKLNDSRHLFLAQDRPIPAEKLIREAMVIYEERRDAQGLGHANRQYGELLQSSAVVKRETVYRRDGFQEKSITFDNRLEKASDFYRKAISYYQRAEQEHRQAGSYDKLTNIYLNMAESTLNLNEKDKACGYYDKTLEAYDENIRRNTGAKPYFPPNSGSFAEYITSKKHQAACQ